MKLLTLISFLVVVLVSGSFVYAIDKVPPDTVYVEVVEEVEDDKFAPSYFISIGTATRLDYRDIIENDPSLHLRFTSIFTRFTEAKIGVSFKQVQFKPINDMPGAELFNLTLESGARWFVPHESVRPYLGLGFEFNYYSSSENDTYANRIGLNISTGIEINFTKVLALDIELSQTFNHVNYPSTNFGDWPDNLDDEDLVGINNGRFDEHLYNPSWLRIFVMYKLK